MTDSSVPREWHAYADQVDQIAHTLRVYFGTDPLWTPGSKAEAEKAQQDEFAALSIQNPVTSALVHPAMTMGFAIDHLVALSAVVRAEETVLAVHSLLRPILVAAGTASHIADAPDVKERVRRAVNLQLASLTEMMRMLKDVSPEYFADRQKRRSEIVTSARGIWKHVSKPESKKGRINDWYVGDEPPGRDMEMARAALKYADSPQFADMAYRLTSATTHVQSHGLMTFMGTEAKANENGYWNAPIGMSQHSLLLWLLASALAIWGSFRSCASLYGWDTGLWDTTVHPLMVEWNKRLQQHTRQDAVDRTGLWLPPVV